MEHNEPVTKSVCQHCRQTTESGIRNGCSGCGKVKHTANGRRKQKSS